MPETAESVPVGVEVSAGTYRCTSCGLRCSVGSNKSLPQCPHCSSGEWQIASVGDGGPGSLDGPIDRKGFRSSAAGNRAGAGT
jgi:hypothetical protein